MLDSAAAAAHGGESPRHGARDVNRALFGDQGNRVTFPVNLALLGIDEAEPVLNAASSCASLARLNMSTAAACRPAASTTSCWPSPPKARLDPGFSGHVLRHTFGTRLIRDGHDLVLVAELMGHTRTETTRGYSLPTADDAQAAINSLPADR